MELLSESDPAAELPDEAIVLLARPSLLRNLGFWLLALLVGSALLLLTVCFSTAQSSGHSDSFGAAYVAALAAAVAAVLSLAALPLLLLLLPWALTASSMGMRWLRVFTLQSASLSGLTALGYYWAGGSDHSSFGAAAPIVGTLYFVAGLLAAALVYRPWLRQLP